MSKQLTTITLPRGYDADEWCSACSVAYGRLEMDSSCKVESIRQPEFVGSDQGGSYWQVTSDTLEGDVLKVTIHVAL